jgi:hypothetical protein
MYWIGSTGVGSTNVVQTGGLTGTSSTAAGLPTNNRTLYVRLWFLVNSAWISNDYIYTAF